MTINKALLLIENEYRKALGLEFVRNPVAYALYQVWRMADTESQKGVEGVSDGKV